MSQSRFLYQPIESRTAKTDLCEVQAKLRRSRAARMHAHGAQSVLHCAGPAERAADSPVAQGRKVNEACSQPADGAAKAAQTQSSHSRAAAPPLLGKDDDAIEAAEPAQGQNRHSSVAAPPLPGDEMIQRWLCQRQRRAAAAGLWRCRRCRCGACSATATPPLLAHRPTLSAPRGPWIAAPTGTRAAARCPSPPR